MDEHYYQRFAYPDVNLEGGGKTGGQISAWEKIFNLPLLQTSGTPDADWFNRDLSATVVDFSKWNGKIRWAHFWSMVDGAIGRLGHGNIEDYRFDDVTRLGFNLPSGDSKYKADRKSVV